MPKIPTYAARGEITTTTPSVQANIQAPLNTSLTSVGSAIAQYYVAEKKEEARVKSSEYENESWNELYNIYDKYKNNPYPTDATNGFLADSEAYKKNFLNTRLANESNFTKKAWIEKFDNNKSSTLITLNRAARDNLENKNQEQFNTFASSMSTRLRLDPSFSNKVIFEIDNEVSKIEDPFVKEEKRKELINIKDATILDVDKRSNPMGLLKQLKDNPDLYSNIPEEKDKAIIFAQNKIKEMNENYFQDSIDSVIVNTPFGQLSDVSSLIDSSINKFFTDPKDQAKAKTSIQSSFKQKIKTITEKGGAEYFINNDPKIKELYNSSLTDPNDFKTYVQILDNKYNEQKVPNNFRTYLPTNKITEINETISMKG